MKKLKIYTLLVILAMGSLLLAELPLHRQLNHLRYDSKRERDLHLPFTMRLDKWLPNHSRLSLGGSYYLTTPYYFGFSGDFYLRFNPMNPRAYVTPDMRATAIEDGIQFRTGEVIRAKHLYPEDVDDIKDQLGYLLVLFRSLGTPIPELILGSRDDIETWVIVYEDDVKHRVIFPSFYDSVIALNDYYQDYIPYFQIDEVRKMNSRLEFFGKLLALNTKNQTTDFIDVRFSTNRQNEIHLVMFFIYRKTDNIRMQISGE
jgi:hypothetical protein